MPSCGVNRDGDVQHIPPAPTQLATDQAEDVAPEYPDNGTSSEAAHEDWVSDKLDWGDRRNLVAYRWCQLWNKFTTEKVDCGIKPDGVD